MKKLLVLLTFFQLIYISIYSQTTLSTGDIAFTAMNTDGNLTATPFDYFSMVALVPISGGTQIRFSDVQYLDASGFASPNGISEFEFVWTAPAEGIAYLEQVTFWATGTVAPPTPHTDKGTVSGDGLTLSSGGDEIFAVQGASMNSGTIIAGIHSNVSLFVTTGPSNWDDGCSVSSTESELPNSLTNGVNAIWLYDTGPSEVDNAIFNECGSVSSSSSAAANRIVINDIANWIKDNNNTFSTPPCGAVLPVEISTFEGFNNENGVELNWQTATEVNNYGFEIERTSVISSEQSELKNLSWGKVGFVEGYGNSNSEKNYSFQDSPKSEGVYSYRLKQIDFDGKFKYSSVVEVEFKTVDEFALEQNYPNPFNPTTSISYSIPQNEFVTLKVYDVIGNEIATLVNTLQDSGIHEVTFNAANLSSGIYFYKFTAGSFSQMNKMLLIK